MTTTSSLQGLSTMEVVQRSGATFRQLDYWDKIGVLTPSVRRAQGSGSGKGRRYSEADAEIAAVLARLSRMTASGFRRVAEVLRTGRRRFWLDDDGEIATKRTGPVMLLVDLEE